MKGRSCPSLDWLQGFWSAQIRSPIWESGDSELTLQNMPAWCLFPWLMTNMTAPTSSKEFLLTIPSLDREYVTTALPDPPQLHARLFEVMPYPRVPRYFRRHWW